MGKALPQMEVRFKNISVSVDVMVSSEQKTQDLPTMANALKKIGRSKKQHKITKHILKDVNGVFKPGTLTLILGQPGSGKSSLLKILAGRFPVTKNVSMEGEVTYNGTQQHDINMRLPQYVSYVTQRDNHFSTLTVKETLEFAHTCCGGPELPERDERHYTRGSPEENKLGLDAARALNKHYPEIVLQQLGLENCQNTVVGDALVRGISGGERKRVTTGEMSFGNKFVNLMDEISTGLDSAATYDIIKMYRSLAKKLRKTIVMALQQPAPEVFALFDDVMILNQGHVMYHGPRDQALGYFENLGFSCPPDRDVADFLLDLGMPQQLKYEVARTDGRQPPRKPREFAEVFAKSPIHDKMLEDLHGPHDPALLNDNELHFNYIPEFHQSFMESTLTLIARQLRIILRNKAYVRSRIILMTVMGLLYSSVFWQLDVKDAQVVMGILFFALLFMSLSQTSRIPVFMADRGVFYKQRGANFFRTSSYVLAVSVSQIPMAIIETVIFGTLLYWMCGFVSDVGSFFLFELLFFLVSLTFAAWFFFLSAVSPNLHVAKPLSLVTLMLFVLFAGFIMSRKTIPDYFIWAYWLNPIAWSMRALAVNQYRHSKYDTCVYDGIDYCTKYGKKMGIYSLGLFDVQTEKEWLSWGYVFMAGAYVIFMGISAYALEHKRFESPGHITIDANDDDEFAITSSKVSNTGSEYGLIETPRTDLKGDLVVQDLWYSVPDPNDPKGEPLTLLKGISGFATPGSITVLMGSSGAGKTTLMDVIAGRKTGGKIQGEILLNGHPASDLSIRRATGYCEQMDIHSEASTFREALTFSAFLRQGSDVPDSQKYDSVEEVLDLLDLRPIADQIIRGSSVEQMKRLTIDVELAAQPSVLFLDEPTSGLDARSAKVIMDGVRKVANTGRTVVCTIHQPSWEVFSVFDSLLLLKLGGEIVYFEGYNPATWMLEVIGAGVGNAVKAEIDFVSVFESSAKKALLDENLARPGHQCWTRPGILGHRFIGIISFNTSLPLASEERASFYRERAAETYNAFWYLVGATLAEIPYVAFNTMLYLAIFFPLVGFTGVSPFFMFWFNLTLHALLRTYMGHLCAYALATVELATIIGILINGICFLFMGFNPPASAIPKGYKWLHHLIPQTYSLSAGSAIIFDECSDPSELGCKRILEVPPILPPNLTIKEYVDHVFLVKHDELWRNIGTMHCRRHKAMVPDLRIHWVDGFANGEVAQCLCDADLHVNKVEEHGIVQLLDALDAFELLDVETTASIAAIVRRVPLFRDVWLGLVQEPHPFAHELDRATEFVFTNGLQRRLTLGHVLGEVDEGAHRFHWSVVLTAK
ncbi:hypothetical protein Poli38472_011136 [Pythium oligandrum]|uniref:ABC transporter domain-containing protein n=1 Tax=Pythium oligandrum TaxID=41045 RepID=A0A8K1FLU3_PYTOL|nr:hypothetical protein Poli38472_011136 [Pythium oligandrum]|eukprot:TMW67516.1 hypothetical protein Poli38472_011136 [Pythium oligandrum]